MQRNSESVVMCPGNHLQDRQISYGDESELFPGIHHVRDHLQKTNDEETDADERDFIETQAKLSPAWANAGEGSATMYPVVLSISSPGPGIRGTRFLLPELQSHRNVGRTENRSQTVIPGGLGCPGI
jgi:hypothetical protein